MKNNITQIRLTVSITLFLLLPFYISASVDKLKSVKLGPAEAPAIIEAIVNNPSNAVPELIKLIEEKSDVQLKGADAVKEKNVRVTAINILGELKEKSALAPLKKILTTSDNSSLIFNAARSIGSIGGVKGFKILSHALSLSENYPHPRGDMVKRAAIIGLGLCGSEQAIPVLEKELNNQNNSLLIRIYTAGSLGLLDSNVGLDLVSQGTQSDDPQIRLRSIQALGLIGDADSVKPIHKLSEKYQSYIIKKAVALSLAQIEVKQLPSYNKVEFLKKTLQQHGKKTEFIRWGTGILSTMNTDEANAALEELANTENKRFSDLKHAARVKIKAKRFFETSN